MFVWLMRIVTWGLEHWQEYQSSQTLVRLHDQVQYHIRTKTKPSSWWRTWRSDVGYGVSHAYPTYVIEGGRVVRAPHNRKRKALVDRTAEIYTAVIIDPVHNYEIDVTRALQAYLTFEENHLTVAEVIPWLLYVHGCSCGITSLSTMLISHSKNELQSLKAHQIV